MRTEFRIKGVFRFEPNVTVTFADAVEVSLACATCQRNDRTIVLRPASAICAKNGHELAARLDGPVASVTSGLTVVTYAVVYDAGAFVDAKNGEAAKRYPTWARIAFTLTCPACGRRKDTSTQTNLVRPFDVRCACDRLLYQETGQLPLFECWPA